MAMLALEIAGIQIPDARPVFLAALGVHVAAGLTGVIAGAAGYARTRSEWAAPT
jgi:hypothetical protein